MNITITWNDEKFDKDINDRISQELKSIKRQDMFTDIDVVVSLQQNQRHIIELRIKTKNVGETITVSGYACNYDCSLFDLMNKLHNVVKKYNPNDYIKQQEEIERRRKENEERVIKEKEKIEALQEDERKRVQREKDLLMEQQARAFKENSKRLSQSHQRRSKIDKELDDDVLEEIERDYNIASKKHLSKTKNVNKILEYIDNAQRIIERDIAISKERTDEYKESKDKLKELWSQENETLVIIDEINEWKAKVFNDEYYLPFESFQLVPDKTIYHDGHENYFIWNVAKNDWDPYDIKSVNEDFEKFKQEKIKQLNDDLIAARAKNPVHLKDIKDTSDIVKEVKESKRKRKEEAKLHKRELKRLKKEVEVSEKKLKRMDDFEENNYQVNDSAADVFESHAANESFLTDSGLYAYHDGQGNYYIYENDNWTPTTKAAVYQKSSNQQSSGFNDEDASSDKSSLRAQKKAEKANLKAQKQAEKDNLKAQKLEAKAQKQAEKENLRAQKQAQKHHGDDTQGDDFSNNSLSNGEGFGSSDASASSGGGQQWQDENGYWWYLDENGNYYYADENGNWIPYQG